MHLIDLVVELHIEAIGLDVGRVARLAGKDISLVSTIPYIQDVALGCITRYDIVGGINMPIILVSNEPHIDSISTNGAPVIMS